MQKLVWQNANGETIDLTSGSYGITEWEGFSNASLNIQSQQVPFQDGAVFLDALIEPRELSVTLAMQDNNDLELRYQLRRELIHKLNPKLGEGYLIYTNDFISKRIKCVAQIPLFETHNSNDSGTPKASLSWVANEPYWEDLEETVVAISGLNTIQNNGDVSAQVEIFIPQGSSNPIIMNRQNQKKIKLSGTYNNNIKINTKSGQKTVTSEGITFSWVSGGIFKGVAYKDGKYIYVGSQIVIEDYLTGEIVSVESPTKNTLNNIIYANNIIVAVGDNGTIISSTDGITWTSRTSGISQNINGITYGNNIFVAVGGDYSLTSPDGITWTITSSNNIPSKDVIYANNLFVAVGAIDMLHSINIKTSTDGITWTSRSSGSVNDLNGITYANNLFVAVGSEIVTSPDGITWTSRMTNITQLYSVIYAKGMFEAVGNGRIFTSVDGITWDIVNRGSFIYYDIIYKNEYFTAVGNKGEIAVSPDCINWNIKTRTNANVSINDITFGNGIYVALTSVINQGLITSNDLYTWTSRDTTPYFRRIIFAKDIFVVIGDSGRIKTSSDGITWTTRTSNTNKNLFNIVFVNNLFVVVGSEGAILTSPDGITWTSQTSGINDTLRGIAYGFNTFVAVGYSNTSAVILTSTDGISWTSRTTSETNALYNIAYGNNMFLAVGNNGVILSSLDGITWTSQSSGESMTLLKVTSGDNIFIVLGASAQNNVILISQDGIEWNATNIVSTQINGISFAGDFFIAGGNNAVIIKSYNINKVNLISDLAPDSDMTFNLEVGNNDILYSDDNGNGATLKFRQKYIGV